MVVEEILEIGESGDNWSRKGQVSLRVAVNRFRIDGQRSFVGQNCVFFILFFIGGGGLREVGLTIRHTHSYDWPACMFGFRRSNLRTVPNQCFVGQVPLSIPCQIIS